MRSYRLVLLLKSDLKKDKKDKLMSDIKKWAGEIKEEKVSEIGERKLAYPVKRERRGDYLLLEFKADTVKGDLEKRIQIQDEVLRHLLVRVD